MYIANALNLLNQSKAEGLQQIQCLYAIAHQIKRL